MIALRSGCMALALVVACAETQSEVQVAKIADLEYAVPLGWEPRDIGPIEPGATRVEWRPQDGTRGETLTVLVTPPLPALNGKGIDAALPLVAPMVQTLPNARFDAATTFTSQRGLRAVTIRGAYVPTGTQAPVTRSHAVLEHGDRLVHVIYTAGSEDPNREAFQAVLDSLHVVVGGVR